MIPRLKRAAAVVGSLLLALLLAEIALRVLDHRSVQARLRAANDGGMRSLGSIKQYSQHPRIIFELRPDLVDVPFLDAPVSTNSLGFRGPEVSAEKPPGVVRIVGLGDSVMFGWGVRWEESFLAQLERMLNERHPERRWEVINTGVPGYNTVMEVATLREKGLRLDPDLVILGLVGNDLNLPTLLAQRRDHLGLSESFLKTFALERFGLIAPSADLFMPQERDETNYRLFEQDPDRLLPEYRGMVGWDAFEEALDDLQAMSREHGFEVVTLRMWWWSMLRELEERAAARGFSTTLAMDAPDDYTADWLLEQGLQLSESDPHPSAKMHRIAADALYANLARMGWLERTLE